MEVEYKKVPCVQEMTKKKLVTIPSRYVRDDLDHSVASSNKEVPVVDMQILINSNDHELQKLYFAAKEWGFFQLINHGVSCSLVEKMKHEVQEFFNLPLEEKNKFERLPGDTDGFGQLFVLSDEQKLDWIDLFYLKTAPPYLRMPIFSKLSLSLRETIEEYSEEVKKLSMQILEMMGKALGIEEKEVKNLFEEGMQSMSMNYYPPCPQPEKVMGRCPHSDAVALTILLQVNETEGLQIKKDGIWIPIVPLPNAFVVNVGDAFEELAKKKLVTIPSRYVRDDLDRSVASSDKEVPVIDMQILINSDDHDSMNLELGKLHSVAKEWGFFQLINPGVSCSVVEKMKHEIEEFFNLPLEEKKKLDRLPGDTDGYGQMFVVSDEQKLDWADLIHLKTSPPHLRMPVFSKLPVSFRETIEEYSEEINDLSMKVLKLLCKAAGIKEEEVDNLFEKGRQSMRMNYYPPCPQPELVMGFCPHSDASSLTILLQVNETEGLQVKKDGIWIPIVPLPNAFVVNIGDAFEVFSNGIYRSIEHRSVVNSEKERMSVATFQSPRLDGEIGPASSLITANNPPKFKKIKVTEFYKGFFNRELIGKSFLNTLRITSEDDLKNIN